MPGGPPVPVSHARRAWLYVLGGLIALFLVLPVLVVIPMSFSDTVYLEFPPRQWSLRNYRAFFGSVEWRDATWVSVRAALVTTVAATVLGTAAAYGLAVTRWRWSRAAQVLLLAPQMVPAILVAIGLFYLYAKLELVNTLLGLVLAHTLLALPFVVVTVTAGLASFDMTQEMVARSLGASRLRAVLTVTLPQIRHSLVSAALFAFITSLDEVVVALFISGGENATLTRRMFSALRDQIDPTIAAISTLLIVISVGLLAAAQLLGRARPAGRSG
ncbi:MAG TPA: ABC transporter permease [Methylomirabilota bacterium]|jgi:putative spermidine/putrescine transport system permease protein|nr:ABC transporter permease [Methylomirabilota bacterium]